jgi:hypothetical protein
MANHGKCAKCEGRISNFAVDKVRIGSALSGPFFYGISICCPYCETIIGVYVSPDDNQKIKPEA